MVPSPALPQDAAKRDSKGLLELEVLCKDAGADFPKMVEEAHSSPDLYIGTKHGGMNDSAYSEAMKVVKHFRYTSKFAEVMSSKMYLGAEAMRNIGNVYTASLPAWIAAGFDDALDRHIDLSGKTFFTLGYGSGDSAEAMLVRVSECRLKTAKKVGFKRAMEGAVDLRLDEYEALHDGLNPHCPSYSPSKQFVIDGVGESFDRDFQDRGISYYKYIS